jgi:hypothetical protein
VVSGRVTMFVCAAMAAFYRYRVRTQLAMERLRNPITSDLHDDIGSSLTQISILSEIGRRHAGHTLGNRWDRQRYGCRDERDCLGHRSAPRPF